MAEGLENVPDRDDLRGEALTASVLDERGRCLEQLTGSNEKPIGSIPLVREAVRFDCTYLRCERRRSQPVAPACLDSSTERIAEPPGLVRHVHPECEAFGLHQSGLAPLAVERSIVNP